MLFRSLKHSSVLGLEKILELVKDDVDGFRAFISASRALEYRDRYLVSGFDIPAAEIVVKNAPAKFVDAADHLYKYQDALLDYLRVSGVLTDKAVADMRLLNKAHVPLYRLFDNEVNAQLPPAAKASVPRNPKKRATGSGATVIDPLESIIKDTYTCITLGDRNLPLKTFFEQVAQSNFAREIFDDVEPSFEETIVSKQEMERFLKKYGVPKNAIPDSLLTVYRAKNTPLRDSQVGYFVDGKWKVAEMHNRELAQALRGLRPQEMNLLVKTMKVMADTLRLGVVLDPMYSIGNFFKDNLTAPFYVKGFRSEEHTSELQSH